MPTPPLCAPAWPVTQVPNHYGYTVHPSAIVDEGAHIGAGSRIWHFVHVCAEARIGQGVFIGQNVFVGNQVVIGNQCKVQEQCQRVRQRHA